MKEQHPSPTSWTDMSMMEPWNTTRRPTTPDAILPGGARASATMLWSTSHPSSLPTNGKGCRIQRRPKADPSATPQSIAT
jgi:hypothetical protein